MGPTNAFDKEELIGQWKTGLVSTQLGCHMCHGSAMVKTIVPEMFKISVRGHLCGREKHIIEDRL